MKAKNKKYDKTPSSTPVMGQPKDADELINKYGTFNIQPTAESETDFPAIAQGYPKNAYRQSRGSSKSDCK